MCLIRLIPFQNRQKMYTPFLVFPFQSKLVLGYVCCFLPKKCVKIT